MSNATLLKCDCDRCAGEVSLESAISKDGKYYCCEACANGHVSDQSCKTSGCSCG